MLIFEKNKKNTITLILLAFIILLFIFTLSFYIFLFNYDVIYYIQYCDEYTAPSCQFYSIYKVNNLYNGVHHNPLDQFIVLSKIYINIFNSKNIIISNGSLCLIISALITLTSFALNTNIKKIRDNRSSIYQGSIFHTIYNIAISQINANEGQRYFPLIYTIFIIILVNNLVGMIPYGFSTSSHFVITFFLSFTVVFGASILGLSKYLFNFFCLLVPSGTPLLITPLLVSIETISYIARNISLGLRLAANVLSGHMLLNILSGFAYNILNSVFFILFVIPLLFILAFSGLETGIAFIQAQVFGVLSGSYTKDGSTQH